MATELLYNIIVHLDGAKDKEFVLQYSIDSPYCNEMEAIKCLREYGYASSINFKTEDGNMITIPPHKMCDVWFEARPAPRARR